MNFLLFRNTFSGLACFNIDQIYSCIPDFDRNNLSRWIRKGLLNRLRQGWYTFPENISRTGFALYFANKIYRPSYISLHSALSFYGIIPEAVVQITSVTSLKTASFRNTFGEYSYRSLLPELFFGYDLKPFTDQMVLQIAFPEKALLDLIYLYPEYKTVKDFEDLRLDDDFLHEELKKELFKDYMGRFRNLAMEKRIKNLLIAYQL